MVQCGASERRYRVHFIKLNDTTRKEREMEIAAMTASITTAPVRQGTEKLVKNIALKRKSEDDTVVGTEDYSTEAMNDVMERYRLPLSHQVQLVGHDKSISALAVDPAGIRAATGSMDYAVKLWDFAGMSRSVKAFREIEVEEGHPIVAVSYSPTGSHLLAATASSQPKVLTREGIEVLQTVKGDMYIRDMVVTFGHTHAVTGGHWHPTDKERWMTCSLDGTLREWHLQGKTTFEKLKNERVWKARSKRGLRVGVTACAFSPTADLMWAGTADGQLQAFDPRKKAVTVRPERVVKEAHDTGSVEGLGITCVAVAPNGFYLASRGADSCVRVWDIRKMGVPQALKTFAGMHTLVPTANCAFSPTSTSLAVGTNVERQTIGNDLPGRLHLLDVSSASTTPLHSAVLDSSVGCVNWSTVTNQIMVGLQNGNTSLLYNPSMCTKGALISATRKLRPLPSIEMFARIDGVGEVQNPNALPMYREEENFTDQRLRNQARRDPKRSKKPELPLEGPVSRGGSGMFTQFVMANRKKETSIREADPREAILQYASKAEQNPKYVSQAYAEANEVDPRYRMTKKTLEQEKIDKQKVQDRLLNN